MTPAHLKVWPGLAPGENSSSPGYVDENRGGNVRALTGVTGAELFVYPLGSERKRPTVLVLPGGGYDILAADLEGSEIAAWLNSLGYTAAVLHYRVPQKQDGALQDAQRAMSLLRFRAAEFGIDANCLGVLGFSAGGHLATRLAVNGEERAYQRQDETDTLPCRPDFALLIYPAYLIDRADRSVMPEVAPRAGMPPMFLAQSEDDPHFCTSDYAAALEAVQGDVQNCVYDSGGHGYGVRLPSDVPASRWQSDAAAWLERRCI